MNLELKTQLNMAKDSLKYLQRQIEGELAKKLMGRESVIEEFTLHMKNSKISFKELYERIAHLTAWKETFDGFYTKSLDDLRRRISDCISRDDLSKYNEEQAELYELKFQTCREEIKGISERVGDAGMSKEETIRLSLEISKLKKRLDLMENKIEDSIVRVNKRVEEKLIGLRESEEKNGNEMEKISEQVNTRLEEAEKEIRRLKSQCEKLASKNNELNNKLPNQDAYNEYINEIDDVKAAVNGVEETQKSVLKRLLELEKNKTFNSKLEVIEKRLNNIEERINNNLIHDEMIQSLKDDIKELKEMNSSSINKHIVNSEMKEAVNESYKRTSQVEQLNVRQEISKSEDSKEDNVDDFKDALIHNALEDSQNKKNRGVNDFLEDLPDADDFEASASRTNSKLAETLKKNELDYLDKQEEAEDFGDDLLNIEDNNKHPKGYTDINVKEILKHEVKKESPAAEEASNFEDEWLA